MKKILITLSAVCLLSLTPIQTSAKSISTPIMQSNKPAGDTAGLYVLVNRMEEIKGLNKSELNFSEKKQLRKELRDIHSKMKSMNYIYISAGTLLLIIILLIILI